MENITNPQTNNENTKNNKKLKTSYEKSNQSKLRKNLIFIIVISLLITIIIGIINYKLNNHNQELLEVGGGGYKSAIVYDMTNQKVLFEANAHTPLPTASIAKIVTAIIAIENIAIDKYYLVDSQINQAVGSRIYLEVGDLISVRDLLYGLILESGNDAALALALAYYSEADFVAKMNQLVTDLKLKNSKFENPSGLDETTINKSSAYDIAVLSSYAFQNPFFQEIVKTKKYVTTLPTNKTLYFNHKHRLVQSDSNVIGGKTGYTELAGRTLVTFFQGNNRQLVVVTMDAYNDWEIHRYLGKTYA